LGFGLGLAGVVLAVGAYAGFVRGGIDARSLPHPATRTRSSAAHGAARWAAIGKTDVIGKH
jgi:hypothetical protein